MAVDILQDGTPLEPHILGGSPVLVKREDLCCPYPGPSFSKIRGVLAHIRSRPEFNTIGVLDTAHSKAGWAVSYVCNALGGRTVVNYWPEYQAHPGRVLPQQLEAQKLGAKLVALKAGRSAILYHAAKRDLLQCDRRDFTEQVHEGRPRVYMMPNALKLSESVTENAAEVLRTPDLPPCGTLVISVSSGTVAAGVLRGMRERGLLDGYHVILHLGYTRSHSELINYVLTSSQTTMAQCGLRLIDEGYDYADHAKNIVAPFPCNPFYDLKAWKWLERSVVGLIQPVVFWNIGD